jgi:hypothetical protein
MSTDPRIRGVASWRLHAMETSTTPSFFERGVAQGAWHHVHFHDTDAGWLADLSAFLERALKPGHVAVLAITPAHLEMLRKHARHTGLDLEMAEANGQFVAMDAHELLSRILVEDRPSRTRFQVVVPGLLRIVAREHPHLHVYGEMVALLWEAGNVQGVHRLERLWNELGQEHSFELLCGYPRNMFDMEKHRAEYVHICAAHSTVWAA